MSASHLEFLLALDRAHTTLARRVDTRLGALHGIGLKDLHLLVTLDRAPERRLRRIDLAQALGVTPSGVTWMLRPLTKRRLVASADSATDARVTYAVLTDGGRALMADAVPSARELAADLVGAHGARAELTAALALLERLAG